MLPAERKRTIVEQVSEEGGRSVSELAETLGYSEATIRRDLRDLEDAGEIERSHGGAVPVRSMASEPSYSERGVKNLDAKRAIGRRAAREITPGEVVFFDSGTTTMQVVHAAPEDGSFIAATNSPPAAMELADRNGEVKVTGGTLRRQTYALVGPTGESFLERTNFDLVFLGTNGLDLSAGLTTPNEDEMRMKSLMVEKGERVVLVTDGTKLGRRSFFKFAELDEVDAVVVDVVLPEAYREAFEAAGVEVVDGVAGDGADPEGRQLAETDGSDT